MKFMIASDLHGSAFFADKVVEIFNKEAADKLIVLGDVYNHGPRNPLPKDYAPMKVAEILNSIKDRLIVIKGNCDSEVDKMISEFDFLDGLCLVSGERSVFLTHGHIFNKDNPPKTHFDAVIYGHFHTGFIECAAESAADGRGEEKTAGSNVIYANAGSVSLPKGGTPQSYLVLKDAVLQLKTLDGLIIKEQKIG